MGNQKHHSSYNATKSPQDIIIFEKNFASLLETTFSKKISVDNKKNFLAAAKLLLTKNPGLTTSKDLDGYVNCSLNKEEILRAIKNPSQKKLPSLTPSLIVKKINLPKQDHALSKKTKPNIKFFGNPKNFKTSSLSKNSKPNCRQPF
jgi:hypothetical protein